MENLPQLDADKGVAFTIADFFKAGRERLLLSVVAGEENMDVVMEEPIVNRPGLALTGFYENFAAGRVQFIGNAETAYLKSLPLETRIERLRKLTERNARLFVCTDGNLFDKEVLEMLDSAGAVVFATPLKTRSVSRIATFVLEQLGAPRTSIYGTMVEVCGLGVLFEGDPGLGKSETALGLIKRGCSLVADDLTCIRKDVATGFLFGSASNATAGFMEIRGIGIMHVPSIFGVNAVRGEKRLQLVITFRRLNEIRSEVDRIGQTRRTRRILGEDIPNIIIPVSEGRDMVNLVETAAQQHKLTRSGYDPITELSDRLHRRAARSEYEKKKGQF